MVARVIGEDIDKNCFFIMAPSFLSFSRDRLSKYLSCNMALLEELAGSCE
jgi:hypothetical protein